MTDPEIPADAVEAMARAMCDRVNGQGDFDAHIEQRRSGWEAQARAGLTALSARQAAAPGGEEEHYASIVAWRTAFDAMHQRAMKAEAALSTPSVGEIAEKIRDLRERARGDLPGWRVHDPHFFDWLSANVGPINIEYLRHLYLNGEVLAGLSTPSASVERATIERCAKAAEKQFSASGWNGDYKYAARAVAAAIRRLADGEGTK